MGDNNVLSGAAWTEDVIVTAAHTRWAKRRAFCINRDLDVAFIRSESKLPKYKWRQPKINEDVEYMGRTLRPRGSGVEKIFLSVEGTVEGWQPIPWDNPEEEIILMLGTGVVVKGMSGGPVRSRVDNNIVGINIAKARSKSGWFTLFQTTDVIQTVWEECNAT